MVGRRSAIIKDKPCVLSVPPLYLQDITLVSTVGLNKPEVRGGAVRFEVKFGSEVRTMGRRPILRKWPTLEKKKRKKSESESEFENI